MSQAVEGLQGASGSEALIQDEIHHLFDYVMVFKLNKGKQSGISKHCITRMLEAGLDIYPYLSIQKDELIVLIGCPDHILREFADKLNFGLQLDPPTLEKIITTGNSAKNIAGLEIRNGTVEDPKRFGNFYEPFEYIYGRYDQIHEAILILDENGQNKYIYGAEECQRAVESGLATQADIRCLYTKKNASEKNSSVFSPIARLKLIYYILEGSREGGGCGLLLAKFVKNNWIDAFYPLHDGEIAKQLQASCCSVCVAPWKMPFGALRDYFGERFTLFYVFLGHYCSQLFIPALVGTAFQLVAWSYNDYSHPVLPFFGVVITIWAIVFLETWKRKEFTTALKCGMSDFETAEPDRPEFRGETIKSFINGSPMVYFPQKHQRRRIAQSVSVVATFILLIVAVVAGIYVMRFSLQPQIGRYASYLASAVNSVQIQIFNMIYGFFAVLMTSIGILISILFVKQCCADRENHRTDTAFQDSMIGKTFLFQFVNSYSSFFFLAFIAGNLPRPSALDDFGASQAHFQGECGYANCMEPLSINVAFIFLMRLAMSICLQIVLPIYINRRKFKTETEGYDPASMSRAEIDYLLSEYDIASNDLQNMADVAIEYGYMILFVVALPMSCLYGLFNSYVKSKFGIWRHLNLLQRPVPKGVQDIGTWQTIFELLSYIAVCTNAGIICFTMTVLDGYMLTGRLWIFVGFQWTMIMIQMLVAYMIPDVPEKVEVQLQRQAFYVAKVIDFTPDEFREASEEDPESPSNAVGDIQNAAKSFFISKKQPTSVGQFDKKYAHVNDIPPAGHPTSTAKDACIAAILHGAKALDILDPKPEMITSSAQLEARYSSVPSPPSRPAVEKAVADDGDIEMSFPLDTAISTKADQTYQQLNKDGDSDDEAR